MQNNQTASLVGDFERALEVILARVSVFTDKRCEGALSNGTGLKEEKSRQTIAVAYSGGLDSSALLHLVHRYALERNITLFAFHVHHGISSNADSWLAHCEHECELLGIPLAAQRISLANRNRDGVEQAARMGRYAALGDLCRRHHVSLLLTAHHLDDQAETVLLQMLRGSGIAGIRGMEGLNTAPELLGDPQLFMARPLLDISRIELERFVASRKIAYIDDESNTDPRYARNALRHKVMPALAEYFPGFQQRFVRTAEHAQSAQRLLEDLAAQDLAGCSDGKRIIVSSLMHLSADRIDNALRYWFASQGFRMPTTAWLHEMREQVLGAREDAQLCVTHRDCEVHRYRDRIFLVLRSNEARLHLSPQSFHWHGEACMHFPAYGGRMFFDETDEGCDRDWLLRQDLIIRLRSGGEKLKLAPNRPARSLKHHYQALGIPAWERSHLPIITVAEQVLFAAGIGMNWRGLSSEGVRRVTLRWERG